MFEPHFDNRSQDTHEPLTIDDVGNERDISGWEEDAIEGDFINLQEQNEVPIN